MKKDNSKLDFEATKTKYIGVSSSSEEPYRSTNKSLLDDNLALNKMIRNNKNEDLFDLLTYENF